MEKENEILIEAIYNPDITSEQLAKLFSLLVRLACNPERKRDLIIEVKNVFI